MNSLELSNFRKLFDVKDITYISSYRQNLNSIPFNWQKQAALHSAADDLQLSTDQYRYCVDSDGVPFECLFFPSDTKKLVVNLIGGAFKPGFYPRFIRWKFYNYFKCNTLCIEDPMYMTHTEFRDAMWYYGTKEISYVDKLVIVIQAFMNKLNISSENVIFLGSSGGGTTAIHMANKISGSCCMAFNPQFCPALWNKKTTEYFLNKVNVDLTENDIYGRHKILPIQKSSRYFFAFNASSKLDSIQFNLALKELNIPLIYGISQHNNIVTWFHHSNGINPHNCHPERLGFCLFDFFNDELKRGIDINSFNGISYIINEYLNYYHTHCKIISDYKKQIEEYKKPSPFIKLRLLFLYKITFGRKKIHYKYKLESYGIKV